MKLARISGTEGFSLIELMVVVGIIAILALGIASMSRNPIIDVKGAMFNLRSDLGYARAEAVRRNQEFIIEFGSDMDDGYSYRLCVENWAAEADKDNDCDDVDTDADELEEDVIIKEVVFDQRVEFYDEDPAINAPAGPELVPADTNNAVWPQDDTGDTDGLTFGENANGNDYFTVLPDGTFKLDGGGAVGSGVAYLYAPHPDDGGNKLKTPPLALVVWLAGRSSILVWHPENGATGSWETR